MIDKINEIINRETPYYIFGPDGTINNCFADHKLWDTFNVLCGSWNPPHEGHFSVMKWATENNKAIDTITELSIENCDKGEINAEEVQRRILGLTRVGCNVWVTMAPNFLTKSFLKKGLTFLVGSDTIERVGNLKYCYNSQSLLDLNMRQFKMNRARFIVFERNGKGLDDVSVPEALRQLCSKAEGFVGSNLSSTAIRNDLK